MLSWAKWAKLRRNREFQENNENFDYYPIDDDRLRTFLRGCKFSLEKVKKKLDMYYTMRNAVPEFFANRDVDRPELTELFKIV